MIIFTLKECLHIEHKSLTAPIDDYSNSRNFMWWLRNEAVAFIEVGISKAVLALSGDRDNKALFQEAVLRLNQIHADCALLSETINVTNEDHRFLVLDQLREVNGLQATLILEPASRNTAPALTLASLYVKDTINDSTGDPILVVTPADQIIQDKDAFTLALQNCISVVEGDASNQTIGILGITPIGPETGYGYIKKADNIGSFGEYTVQQFAEKPNLDTAKAY